MKFPIVFIGIILIAGLINPGEKIKFSEVFSNSLIREFNRGGELPLILFSKSNSSVLQNLRKVLKEEYYEPVFMPELKMPPDAKMGNFSITLSEISAQFSGFMIKGFPYKKVLLSFKKLVLDRKKFESKEMKIEEADLIELKLSVDCKKFTEFVRTESERFGIVTPDISILSNGNLKISGNMKLMDFKGIVDVEGEFQISGDNEISFKIIKCNAGGVSIPGFIVDSIATMLNPDVQVQSLPFGLQPVKAKSEGNDIFLLFRSDKYAKKVHQIEYKSSLIKEKLGK